MNCAKQIRIIIILVLLVYLNPAHAQNSDNNTSGRFAIKYTPTSLINLDYPSIDFSLEYLKNEKLSYELTIGYSGLSYYLGVGDTQFIPNRIYKASFEMKYYGFFKNNSSPNRRLYISGQPFFQYRQFNNFAAFGDTTLPGVKVQTDGFSEAESVFGINFKIGSEIMSRHFIFDSWVGFGIKYRYAHAENLNFDPNHFINDFRSVPDFNIPTISYKNSLDLLTHPGLAINLPLGFKIGYVF